MKAIILAGGKGTRLQPLTYTIPKPMLPLYDKPVMEYSIELLKKHGITEIGITLQYRHEQIIEYFGDGSQWGVTLTYFIEKEPLGTAGGIKRAEAFIEEDCIIISGDALTEINLQDVIHFHYEQKSEMTIVTKEVNDVRGYGVVTIDEGNRVTGFVEKPTYEQANSRLINTGVYVIKKSVLDYVNSYGPTDFSFDIIPLLLEYNHTVCSFVTEDYWIDIGQIHHYRQAHYDLWRKWFGNRQESIVSDDALIEEGVTVYDPVYVGENVVIRKGASIGPYTIIGTNSIIEAHAAIDKTILLQNVTVGAESFLYNATIGPYVNVQAMTTYVQDTVAENQVLPQLSVKPDVSIFKNGRLYVHSSVDRERLYNALLLVCKHQGSFCLASDDEGEAIQLRKECFSFLRSNHSAVYDIKKEALPVFRYYMMTSQASIGIYIGVDSKNSGLFLEIYDKKGQLVNQLIEKKIERMYLQAKQANITTSVSLKETSIGNIREEYCDALVKSINQHVLLEDSTRIGVICSPFIQEVVELLCKRLRVHVLFLNKWEKTEEIKRIIKRNKLSFCIQIKEDGETFALYDEKGCSVNDSEIMSLYIYSVYMTKKVAFVPIPIHYSSTLETFAQSLNQSFMRTKAKKRDLLSLLGPVQFQLDAMYALCQLIELIMVQQRKISEMIQYVPHAYMNWRYISCPLEIQEQVMKKLLEEAIGKQVYVIDGLKIYHDPHEWTLILPDGHLPVLNIYSEALNTQTAKKLSAYFVEKIQEYQRV